MEKHPFGLDDGGPSADGDINCPICCEHFQSPVTLGCRHSYCRECLRKYAVGCQGDFKCPTCRIPLLLPKGGVDMLLTNTTIQTLVDSITPKSMCPLCNKLEPLSFCTHCSTEICRACTANHKPEMYAVIKRSADRLRNQQQQSSGGEMNLHLSGERAKKEIDDQVNRFIQQLRDKQTELNESVDRLVGTGLDDEPEPKKPNQDSDYQAILRRADVAIESWESFPQNQAHMLYADCCKMENSPGHSKEVLVSFPNSNDLYQSIRNFGSLTLPGYTFVKPVQNGEGAVGATSLHLEPQQLKTQQTEDDFKGLGIGHPKDVIQCEGNPSGLTCINDVIYVTNPWSETVDMYANTLLMNTAMCHVPTSGKFEPRDIISLPNGDFIVSGNESLQRFTAQGDFVSIVAKKENKKGPVLAPRGLCVHNDELFVVDRDKRQVLVMTLEGLSIRKFGKEFLAEPKYVAVSKDERVLVTDKHKIKIFTVGGLFLEKFTVPGASVWSGTRGIAVNDDGNFLVCIPEQNCVRVYNPELTQIKTIGQKFLSSPQCVCCLPNGRVAVSDWSKKKVYIF